MVVGSINEGYVMSDCEHKRIKCMVCHRDVIAPPTIKEKVLLHEFLNALETEITISLSMDIIDATGTHKWILPDRINNLIELTRRKF